MMSTEMELIDAIFNPVLWLVCMLMVVWLMLPHDED